MMTNARRVVVRALFTSSHGPTVRRAGTPRGVAEPRRLRCHVGRRPRGAGRGGGGASLGRRLRIRGGHDVTAARRTRSVLDDVAAVVRTLRGASSDPLIVINGLPDMGSVPRFARLHLRGQSLFTRHGRGYAVWRAAIAPTLRRVVDASRPEWEDVVD